MDNLRAGCRADDGSLGRPSYGARHSRRFRCGPYPRYRRWTWPKWNCPGQELPNAKVTAVDWPNVLKVAADNVRCADIAECWCALPGSALAVEFGGPYELALVARFLHLMAPNDREALLRRVHAALTPGGRMIVLQILLNEDRVSPPFAAAMDFNVLATTPSGRFRPRANSKLC